MPPSRAELTTYEWLTLPNPCLLERGVNPDARVHYTGHLVALEAAWIPSFGNWGQLDTPDMIDTKHPHLGRIKVSHAAFRQFKHRHGLMTHREWVLQHGPEPWRHAERAYAAYVRRQGAFLARNGVTASLGQVCRAIALEGRQSGAPELYRLGKLPAELVLYVRLFHSFLDGAAYDEWEALIDEDKAATWAVGPKAADRWDIHLFATEPGIRDLAQEHQAGL